MWIRKGFSFKLTPDGAQARKMSRFAGCTRFVYNKGIAWNEEQRNADSNFKISYNLNFPAKLTLKAYEG